jgi:hypothetical protein
MKAALVSAMMGTASAACGLFSPVKVQSLNQLTSNLIHNTRILYPGTAGQYPALTFFHGFALDLESYDELLCPIAENNIVILLQMEFHAISEALDEDAVLIDPYLNDPEKGILGRIGNTIMKGYSYSYLGLAGHSRGGGVLSHAWTSKYLNDGDFHSVTLLDPVVANVANDLPSKVTLQKTKLRAIYFNDPESICVTNGWPDFQGKVDATDINVVEASECKHMDVCSSWVDLLPLCVTFHQGECKQQARDLLTDAGFASSKSVTV